MESFLPLQAKSLLAMFEVLRLLQLSTDSASFVERLADAMIKAMKLHIDAYGLDDVVPKWHAQLHLPEEIKSRGKAWATFSLERKHKIFKLLATPVTNLRRFEHTVLSAILNHQLSTMNDVERNFFAQGSYLRSPVALVPGYEFGCQGDIEASRAASYNMVASAAGDYVLFCVDGSAKRVLLGRVLVHFCAPGNWLHTILEPLQYQPQHKTWLKENVAPMLIKTAAIIGATVWTETRSGIRVLPLVRAEARLV